MYGVHFEQHDDRYARTAEWLEVVDRAWKEDHFSYEGKFYKVSDTVPRPKPLTRPRPVIYAGGESEAAKELINAPVFGSRRTTLFDENPPTSTSPLTAKSICSAKLREVLLWNVPCAVPVRL